MHRHTATFRFYEELNDFLPQHRQKTRFEYAFDGTPAVKDSIEALGVPHTEVDLILVNGQSVDFAHHIQDGDDVAVYPVFESLDISPVIRLRPKPLRESRFILDGHLGKLARNLRLLGFDTLYRNDYDDTEIIRIAERERRIILTRDVGILKHGAVTRGYWIRTTSPEEQTQEVLRRFDLFRQTRPFTRCTVCNGPVEKIAKEKILHRLEPRTKKYYEAFYRCVECDKIYWKGSHHEKMLDKIDRWIKGARRPSSL